MSKACHCERPEGAKPAIKRSGPVRGIIGGQSRFSAGGRIRQKSGGKIEIASLRSHNLISPGMTITDFTSDIPARKKKIEAHKSPMRRLATPEDTAALVAFVASEETGYLNGAHLPLAGGPV